MLKIYWGQFWNDAQFISKFTQQLNDRILHKYWDQFLLQFHLEQFIGHQGLIFRFFRCSFWAYAKTRRITVRESLEWHLGGESFLFYRYAQINETSSWIPQRDPSDSAIVLRRFLSQLRYAWLWESYHCLIDFDWHDRSDVPFYRLSYRPLVELLDWRWLRSRSCWIVFLIQFAK